MHDRHLDTGHAIDRNPVVAGMFYPDDPDLLRHEVRQHLAAAARDAAPTLLAMVPHAGYVYSGEVAGQTLGAANLPDTIVLLGPNHTGLGAPLSVWPGGNWHTPLGPVPVDEELADALAESDAGFTRDTAAHVREHSIEVILPFLQEYTPDLSIVPVAVAEPHPQTLREAAQTLADVLRRVTDAGRRVAMVVSSDMSHYVTHAEAARRDSLALARIEALDPLGLYATVRDRGISMCGVLPATLGLFAALALGAQTARVVAYATSGEVSGDMERVVGYAGVLVA